MKLDTQRIRKRLTARLGKSINRAFCHILNDADYNIGKIAIITGLMSDEVNRAISTDLTDYEQKAVEYATAQDSKADYHKAGVRYLMGFPQMSEEEAEAHADFIVECERWGIKKANMIEKP